MDWSHHHRVGLSLPTNLFLTFIGGEAIDSCLRVTFYLKPLTN